MQCRISVSSLIVYGEWIWIGFSGRSLSLFESEAVPAIRPPSEIILSVFPRRSCSDYDALLFVSLYHPFVVASVDVVVVRIGV